MKLRSFTLLVALFCTAIAVVQTTSGSATAAGDEFVAITPSRVLDTRDGTGGKEGKLGPDSTFTLQVAGAGRSVPADAAAVVINITSTRATQPSFVTVSPAGGTRPSTASLNLEPGQPTPNLVIVGIENGSIDIYNSAGETHLVGDVTGYFVGSSGFKPVEPLRFLDTRENIGTTNGLVTAGQTISVRVANRGTVPATAASVVLNVTATKSTLPTFVTMYPTGTERPLAATLNTEPGQDTPNLAIVRVGDDGFVDLYLDKGSSHLIADVMGYFDGSGGFVAADSPTRLLDTRNGTGAPTGKIDAGEQIDLKVAGVGPVPANATAVVLNITSVASTEQSFVTGWPAGESRPLAASLNTEPAQATPNLAVLKIGAGGAVSLYNDVGSTHLVADVAGWYVPQAKTVPLEFFLESGGGEEGDFCFITFCSFGRYDVDTRADLIEVRAFIGNLQSNDVNTYGRLDAPFSPEGENATALLDVDWKSVLSSTFAIGSLSRITVTASLLDDTGPTKGTTRWTQVLVQEELSAELKGIDSLNVNGGVNRAYDLPKLNTSIDYLLRIEVRCRATANVSIGGTDCDADFGVHGVTIDSSSIVYEPS